MTDLHPSTLAVSAGRPSEPGAPLNAPIVPSSSFRADGDENRYARHHVPASVAALEQVAGALDGGHALAFGSGMAAVAAVLDRLPAGAVVVVPDAAYSGSVSTWHEYEQLGRLTVRRVDIADTAAVAAACPGAALVWAETVTNPIMAVPDLPAIAAAAHDAGALLAVDATFSTPLVARPLDLGADIVMHSATKFLAGHSDALAGLLVTRSDELATALHERRTLAGSVLGVLEAYLTTRGVRTLAVRMERAQANAAELARRCAAHPRVARVRYPGLPDDPGHAIAARDHAGFGAIVGLELDSADGAERVCRSVRLITHATSLGGVESTIERRARYGVDAAFGTPPELLRLSVGIEHVDDLWTDLAQALDVSG